MTIYLLSGGYSLAGSGSNCVPTRANVGQIVAWQRWRLWWDGQIFERSVRPAVFITEARVPPNNTPTIVICGKIGIKKNYLKYANKENHENIGNKGAPDGLGKPFSYSSYTIIGFVIRTICARHMRGSHVKIFLLTRCRLSRLVQIIRTWNTLCF